MASTNNPRKRKELENAKESNVGSLVSMSSSSDSDDRASAGDGSSYAVSLGSKAGKDSEASLSGKSEGESQARASRPQRRGDKQPTSNRPKVKSNRKVRAGQSGSLSGSLSLSGSDSASISNSGKIASASVSGSIDFRGFQERYGDVEEVDPLSAGAAAAQEFRQEKQDERELLKERERKRRKRNRIIKWTVGTIFLLLVAAVVAIVVVFSVFRWQTFDDHADMQGIWKVAGTDAQLTITEDEIKLTEDVAYKYVIDPDSKTIQFTFGNLVGKGHYRFSLDRSMLSIMDGEYEWGDTLFDDAMWTLDALLDQTLNDEQKNPSGDEHITELSKIADIATEEQEAGQQAQPETEPGVE